MGSFNIAVFVHYLAILFLFFVFARFYSHFDVMVNISCDRYQANYKTYKDFPNGVNWRHCGKIVSHWQSVNGFASASETMRNIDEFFYDLTYNSDEITHEITDWITDVFYEAFHNTENWPPFTKYQKEMQNLFREEYSHYNQIYPAIPNKDLQSVVEAEHHSLRFADPRILKYIRERDIMDIGGFIGDSLLVLHNYTDHTIYSFELNPENYVTLKKNSEKIGKKSNVTLMGMGSKEFVSGIDLGGHVSKLNQNSNVKVLISTVDIMSKKYDMNVGLIKADVEGMAYDIMLGAKETLARDRPVLAILVYHSYDEFHGIPQILREIGGYIFQYRGSHTDCGDIAEGMLFAIPQEAYYPKFTNIITSFEDK